LFEFAWLCPKSQKCCGWECCEPEGFFQSELGAFFLFIGLMVLVVVLSGVCLFILEKRKEIRPANVERYGNRRVDHYTDNRRPPPRPTARSNL
ncbi:hypothetical protein PFISCL1PPCAC_2480, partial [Pristionchus fissidentatus]